MRSDACTECLVPLWARRDPLASMDGERWLSAIEARYRDVALNVRDNAAWVRYSVGVLHLAGEFALARLFVAACAVSQSRTERDPLYDADLDGGAE